ncbi:NAD(P)/FAD-dependent oxidoreductase [Flagellimonas sp. S174]|uniref:NAD(P)/FAD-dependent oxidoreductase n=1 Tax=Flagellimonas sp. S174 TaxID=3410790 RepID=UPI003BF49CDA
MMYLQYVNTNEVVIIGGGLAGLTAAIDLTQRGKQVLVIEKNTYPHHKVCGEYVSNEVRPYLQQLGLDVGKLTSVDISTLQLGTYTGKTTQVTLPLGGFGVSRYALDERLYQLAMQSGAEFLFDSVQDVKFNENRFELRLSKQEIMADVVIGAFGKRSNMDKRLKRPFISKKSAWLAVKCHYNGYDFPNHMVSLQTFPGGYGGLSKTEKGHINFCYLAKYEDFKCLGSLKEFQRKVLAKNPILDHFFESATPVFEKPLSIAQVSFDKKKLIENHVLMCGDTAGLIHPLCGNGMAMAIHSAKMAAQCVDMYLEKEEFTREAMEKAYKKVWTEEFQKRLRLGRMLQSLMLHTNWFDFMLSTVASSEKILKGVISGTHGKPILQ